MRLCVHAQIIPNFYHSALEAKSWNEQRCSGICKHWRTEDLQCWKQKNLCQESEAEWFDILCSAVIIAIGVTLCIGVTNYLPRGPKSGGQEILLLSRTKHSTKKNQPTIMKFLSPFSGFGCRGLVFFVVILCRFRKSSERRFSARPRSWNFLMLAIPGAKRWCGLHEICWEAVAKSGNMEQITTEIFQSSN